ncbi:MAG TPA: hypothetical protein VJG90_06870 [Candidatus Nanoarchaeia archaeon]|nr:hypothetical protein [Candidatus Nanoarchaeia archaeon]
MTEEKAEEKAPVLEPVPGYDEDEFGEKKNQKAKGSYSVYKRGGGRRSAK